MILASCFMILVALQGSRMIASAQTTYPEGITVIPSIKHIDLASDPPEYSIRYINNTAADLKLELSVQDFSEIDEDYSVNFLEPKDAENYLYSLSSWISFENKNIELSAGDQREIKVFIDDDRITKGGHHAIILAKVTQENIDEQINITPIISSLLFVRASTGREIETGEILTFRPKRSLVNFPENFILRFRNDGNVHVTPYGKVVITDILGNRVATGILNERSLNALPESIRLYEIPVKKEAKFFIPGVYTAKIDMNYGKNKKEISRTEIFFSQGSINFFYISLILIIGIILLVIFRRRRKTEAKEEVKIETKKKVKSKKK